MGLRDGTRAPARRGRAYLPRGRVIGGTSSMNTMLYVRGHRHDYDTWERLGNPGWGYDDVLPFFKKSEDNERGADDFHGAGGPLAVSDPISVHPLLTAWVEAAQDAGHKHNPDFNGPEQEGVGYHQVTQRNGLRRSSAAAFLEPAAGRANLTVLPSTTALRICFDGSHASLDEECVGRARLVATAGAGPAGEPDRSRKTEAVAGCVARQRAGAGASRSRRPSPHSTGQAAQAIRGVAR
ncbi:GMC family oxidoreductase [Streptomyces asiaticus]